MCACGEVASVVHLCVAWGQESVVCVCARTRVCACVCACVCLCVSMRVLMLFPSCIIVYWSR